MINARKLNPEGIVVFKAWLENPSGELPPGGLLTDEALTEPFGDFEFDPDLEFASRFEFGTYLTKQLSSRDFNDLMAPDSDGFWTWLAIVWFGQLAQKGVRRSEHYLVMRKGTSGSLAYRHAARTSYELVYIHGECALICLSSPMHTFGDMTEQLMSRQAIAHNKGFFQTAFNLYVKEGKLRRGWSTRVKKLQDRKPGDRAGMGGVRRLTVALKRLDLTYDTEEMDAAKTISVLPQEFSKWAPT